MIITLLATNIQYDWDGPGTPTMHDLPESMEVQVDLRDQAGLVITQVYNQISNATGMLVLDYQLVGYSLSSGSTHERLEKYPEIITSRSLREADQRRKDQIFQRKYGLVPMACDRSAKETDFDVPGPRK